MSNKPTTTLGGIRRYKYNSAFQDNIFNKLVKNPTVFETPGDINEKAVKIKSHVAARLQDNRGEFDTPVIYFGVKPDPSNTVIPPPALTINNIGLMFDYSPELRFHIDFNQLKCIDMGVMKRVILHNARFKHTPICTLYDLYCHLALLPVPIPSDSPLQRCIMCNTNAAKYETMIRSLTSTFESGLLHISTTEENIRYIINKAGVLDNDNRTAMTPQYLSYARLNLTAPNQPTTSTDTSGGRGRQRRRGRSLLSRKKRNTRMKKSKKYNKSKKIKK